MINDKKKTMRFRTFFPHTLLFVFAVFIVANVTVQVWAGIEKAPPAVIDAMAAGQPQEVIVLFDDTAIQNTAEAMRQNIGADYDTTEILDMKKAEYDALKQGVIGLLPAEEQETIQDYSHLPMVFMRVNSLGVLQQITERPEVVRVYENEKKYHMLASTLPFIQQPQVAALGMVGTGTTVAVLDNGIDLTQPAFGTCTSPVPGFCSDTNPPAAPAGCKISCTRDFDNGTDHNHGSNVTGIVLGVASDTRVAALNVFRNDGYAYSDRIIQAINWSITNKTAYNIVAMNLSLGGGGSTTPCGGDVFATPVFNARQAGILAAIASGNNAFTNMISSPGCVPAAVSVGAVYDLNYGVQSWSVCTDTTSVPDKVVCFSNSASFLTMLAPGAHVDAAGRVNYSGTSMATPHIAGSIAVIKGANAFPGDTPDQVVTRMTSTGVPDTDPKSGVTTPRIDLLAAVGGGGGTFSISGTVTTGGGTPMTGVTITLGGAGAGTTTTNASGNYSFTGLSNGTYTLTPSIAGYTFSPTSRTAIISGANITGQNFVGTLTGGTYSISGRVTTGGGSSPSPLAGVTITLGGAGAG
ncbi:MAG: S8 family serine peptidase, partial [Nitrospirota bacterium]